MGCQDQEKKSRECVLTLHSPHYLISRSGDHKGRKGAPRTEAADHLLRRDASGIIMAVRFTPKGEVAKEKLRKLPIHISRIHVLEPGLANYASIKMFTSKC